PFATATSTVFLASSLARYTDHASVTGASGMLAMHPAIRTPSFV
ncbi:MAG: hypothetical protein JWO62_2606, partial [Acidimicrobiaceae bacterium]|nr:hypothetical protein [Acidimicrobiaceae bacterium]